jgi:hypothetical protein
MVEGRRENGRCALSPAFRTSLHGYRSRFETALPRCFPQPLRQTVFYPGCIAFRRDEPVRSVAKCRRARWNEKLARLDDCGCFALQLLPVRLFAARPGDVAAGSNEASVRWHEFRPMAYRHCHAATRPAEDSFLRQAQSGLVVRQHGRPGPARVVSAGFRTPGLSLASPQSVA